MQKRNFAQNLLLTLKGLAMGAADVVPGVSGGTIAFISGIYEEFIDSLNKINFHALVVWRKEGTPALWAHINGTFFLFLFAGIGISIFTLSKVIIYLLETYPVLLWSFFFGLIIASVWLVGKTVKKWSIGAIVSLLIGMVLAYWICTIETTVSVDSKWYIVLSGAVGICAMILPGISGSFILVLMGSYHIVYGAIADRNWTIIALFAVGCIVGLLSFARVLKFLFSKYREITITLLTGFMLGSLVKVWPWKANVGDAPIIVHSDGREDWMTTNVLPNAFEGDPQMWLAIACAVGGLLLIVVLEMFAPKEK